MRDDTEGTRDRGLASPDATSGKAAPAREPVERAVSQGVERSTPIAASPALDKVDDASDDSFPASDAPAWTGIRVGSPRSDR